MRFITNLPNLSVVIEPGRQLTNPLTGAQGTLIPNKIMPFKGLVCVAKDDREIRGLLRVLKRNLENGQASTFSIHPADKELAAQFELGDTGDEEKPEHIIAALQEQIATLQAQVAISLGKQKKAKPKSAKGKDGES